MNIMAQGVNCLLIVFKFAAQATTIPSQSAILMAKERHVKATVWGSLLLISRKKHYNGKSFTCETEGNEQEKEGPIQVTWPPW